VIYIVDILGILIDQYVNFYYKSIMLYIRDIFVNGQNVASIHYNNEYLKIISYNSLYEYNKNPCKYLQIEN